jgi:hypothetical protein
MSKMRICTWISGGLECGHIQRADRKSSERRMMRSVNGRSDIYIVRWPALLIQIQKVLGLNLGLETETEGF